MSCRTSNVTESDEQTTRARGLPTEPAGLMKNLQEQRRSTSQRKGRRLENAREEFTRQRERARVSDGCWGARPVLHCDSTSPHTLLLFHCHTILMCLLQAVVPSAVTLLTPQPAHVLRASRSRHEMPHATQPCHTCTHCTSASSCQCFASATFC